MIIFSIKFLLYDLLNIKGGITVGPDSVGKNLTSEAMVFEGGKTMTSTDIAVASGFCENIGNKERVRHITEVVRIGSLEDIKRKIEAAVDRMKVRFENLKFLQIDSEVNP